MSQNTRLPIVAIDGPAGAGKSTVAARLAARFGLLNLETGAMYRAFALKAIECGIAADDEAGLVQLSVETRIGLEPQAGGNCVLLDGRDVTGIIRQADVTQAASQVSTHGRIRSWMVALQQEIGRRGGIVMEGRDIGTAVFPDAEVKIYLDAAPEVRGMRRFEQQSGPVPMAADAVLRDLHQRDERDRNRAESPLRPAADAIILDSSYLSLEETVDKAIEIVASHLPAIAGGQAAH